MVGYRWPGPLLNPTPAPAPLSTAGLLGEDPEELRRARLQQISSILGGLGVGIATGKNWGEGIAMGGQRAAEMAEDARRFGLLEARERREMERQAAEDEQRRRQQEAIAGVAGTLDDPSQRNFAMAFPDQFAAGYGKSLFPDPADAEQAKARAELMALLNGGDPLAGAPVSDGSELPGPAQDFTPRDYRTKLASLESSGGTNTVNPLNPNVSGAYQIDSRYWPQTAGMSPDEALGVVLQTNADAFNQASGRPPLDWEQYGMHRFGATGFQKLMSAAPDTPTEQLFGKTIVGDNPDLAGKTAGQVRSMLSRRMGQGTSWNANQPAPAQTAQPAPAGLDIANLSERDALVLNLLAQQADMGSPFKAADAPSGYRVTGNGNLEAIPGGPADPRSTGLFSGNAMDAQAYNLVFDYETRKAHGEQMTPEQDYAYQLARNHLQTIRTVTGPDQQQYIVQPQALPTMNVPAVTDQASGISSSPSSAPGSAAPIATPLFPDTARKMTPEESAKIAALQEGIKDIDSATGLIAPNNEISTAVTTAGMLGVPFTEGRQARQQMQRGIEAILRAMTGAAAPESEVQRYMGMFFPSPFDSEEASLEKLRRASEWSKTMLKNLSAGRPQVEMPETGSEPGAMNWIRDSSGKLVPAP